MSSNSTHEERHSTPAHASTIRQGIEQDIVQKIRDRVWPHGHRLPPLRSLAASYQVSLLTVSRAIQELTRQGILRSEPRRGVFVANSLSEIPDASLQTPIGIDIQRFLIRHHLRERSLSVVVRGDIAQDTINLASGMMARDAVPSGALRAAIRKVAASYEEVPLTALPYGGKDDVRRWIAESVTQFGIAASPEHVIVTSGSQQGQKLINDALLEPGDIVLVEQPAYPLALSTFEAVGARCVGVPLDPEGGLRLDILEQLVLRHRPRLLYTVSTGQIPTGLTMPVSQRHQLVEIAARHGFLIVESDAGNELFYDGMAPMAIKSFDPGGLVIYLKSFSRLVSAGFRMGSLIIEGPLHDALIDRKRIDDSYTSTLTQDVFLAYVRSRTFHHDIDITRTFYLERRNAALAALAHKMPEGVTWTTPTAGLHTWLTLPEGMSSRLIAERGIRQGIVVAHSEIFMPNDNPDNGIRITFSDAAPDAIAEGIHRLAQVINQATRTHDSDYLLRVN